MRKKKKNFLIVGGTNGLGFSIAEKLNEDGMCLTTFSMSLLAIRGFCRTY